MIRFRLLFATLMLAIGVLVANPVRADDAAAARFHDQRAREHYEHQRFEKAIREFFLAQRIAPNPRNLFNIALCFELLGEDAEAFQMYSEYLAADDLDEERSAKARTAVERLAPRVARLHITTDPPGARIFIDEREHGSYGRSPAVVAVEPGDHRVFVELEQHRPAHESIAADRGDEVEVSLSLEAITGQLEVAASESGRARVRTPAGEVVAEGPTPLTASLSPGPYEVSVSAEGYETHRGLVEVRADATTRHEAELTALPQPVGTLTVTANQPGALVTVDGTPAGFTPLALEAVPVGERSIGVEREDLDPWQGEVEVRNEEPTWLTLTLEEAEPETTHSPATWLLGGAGLAAIVAGGATGIVALRTHADYEEALSSGNPDAVQLRQQGRRLNAVADTLLVVGGVSLAAAVVLFVFEELRDPEPSTAIVSRGDERREPEP